MWCFGEGKEQKHNHRQKPVLAFLYVSRYAVLECTPDRCSHHNPQPCRKWVGFLLRMPSGCNVCSYSEHFPPRSIQPRLCSLGGHSLCIFLEILYVHKVKIMTLHAPRGSSGFKKSILGLLHVRQIRFGIKTEGGQRSNYMIRLWNTRTGGKGSGRWFRVASHSVFCWVG